MTSCPTRTLEGTEVPAAGEWVIDPGHAEVMFIGRHLGLTKIRGRFSGVTGTVMIAEDLRQSTVDVQIDMGSVDSGDQTRDDHLKSGDFFDVAAHPTASFVGTGLTIDSTSGRLTGDLTIKGVTRPIALDVEYIGHATDPWNNERTVFSASATIDREDWGLTWNMILDAGGLLVSKQIRLEFEVELIQRVV